MYGQLLFTPNNPDAPWTIFYFHTFDAIPPTLSPAQAVERGTAMKLLKTEVPELAASEFNHMQLLCRALPGDRPDVASDLFMALAHLRLPPAQRLAREVRIAKELDSYFVGMPLPPEVIAGLDHIKLIAPLTPDAFLEGMVASMAARLQMASMRFPEWVGLCHESVNQLDFLTRELGIESRSEEDRFLVTALFSRPWGERRDFLTLLEWAVKSKLVEAVRKTDAAVRSSGLLLVSEGDVLVKVLQACQAASLDESTQAEIGTVVTNQVALGQSTDLACLRSALTATIEATQRGVFMGSRVRAQNLAAINAANINFWQQLLRMTPERLRLRQKQAKSAVAQPGVAATAPVDLDPVHAWSVNRLLRWIEGPILDQAPTPLERAKFVLKEKATRQEARINTKMSEKAARADPDMTEVEIDIAVQNALSTTAAFFIGDIEDMLFRAETLSVKSLATKPCADLLEPLKLLKGADRSDDQKARALLHQASFAVDQLRHDIKEKQFDVRVRQRFDQQLQAALYSEPMAEGKRNGGVINCRLKRSDWPWVAEQYHRRWLPWNRQIKVDGVLRVLQPDQALGLYVTGKSLSGFEFDVSVHLWLRKAGRDSAPSASPLPFAPMNTEDWIDTLTPCAVLHVPSAT